MKEWKQAVAAGLRLVRGHRSQRLFAEQVDTIQQTLAAFEVGKVPANWRFLARLGEEGVDLNRLLSGEMGRNGR